MGAKSVILLVLGQVRSGQILKGGIIFFKFGFVNPLKSAVEKVAQQILSMKSVNVVSTHFPMEFFHEILHGDLSWDGLGSSKVETIIFLLLLLLLLLFM